MLNPFLNIWFFFSITTFLVIIYILFYFKYIGGFQEIFWKLTYVFITFTILFIYFFFESESLFLIFFNKINDILILKDVQDMVNLSLELSFIYSLYFISPLIIFFIWTYFLNYTSLKKNQIIKIYIVLFIYYVFFLKVILDEDLFLSSWDFFKTLKTYSYDFQPDFVYIIISYIGDFYDLGFLFFMLMLYFFIYNNYQKYFTFNTSKKKLFTVIRILINIFFSLFTFYFLGGESIFRDLFTLLSVFVLFEFYFFIGLFLLNLKRKKINT
jgi:hypothetical protein